MSGTIAQSFYVDSGLSPNGIFVASIDLAFASADDQQAVHVQIRPTINGYPDSNTIVHNAQALLPPSQCNPTTGQGESLPNFSNPSTFARFWFPELVYLPPGLYTLVVDTPSTNYTLWEATIQDTQIGSKNLVSPMALVGTEFTSKDGFTWVANPNTNLMFQINQAIFDISDSSVVEFDSIGIANTTINADVFNVSTNDIPVGPAKIAYSYSAGDTSGAQNPLQVMVDYNPLTRDTLSPGNSNFKIYSSMTSTDPQVSPILDTTRLYVIGIQNWINNGQLSNTLVNIISGGANLTPGTISVSLSAANGAGGIQANAYPVITGNTLTGIIFDQVGSLYVDTPNIQFFGANASSINVSITGETSASGGNSLMRYITNPVTLSRGFTAQGLSVYLNLVKQLGNDVEVYYKALNAYDPDQNLNDKNWVKMAQNGNQNVFSAGINDYIEFNWISPQQALVPPQNISYVSNGITFQGFTTFQLKICFFSSSTTVVPTASGLRGIAVA